MGPSNEDIIKAILHYQERLEKYNANKSEDKMLYALRKLSKLPIKTSHLESTGVGRTVNALKKLTGAVGDSAKNLVMSWKEMVLEEEKASQETSIETEEDADSVYSSENESQDLQMEEGKENVNNQSDSESDSEDYSYKKEIPSKNQNYLENKTSKYKDHKKHDNYSSTNSNSDDDDDDDDDEAETNSRFRKREHSTDSSSDERGRHKSKKSKRESESSSRHHYKDKYTKDEKDKKHDRHSSSSKSKNNEDRSESKHKPKRESEQSNHKLEKYSKHEEKDKKSSHSSKHKSSSSHSSKKESKDKKDKHESKRESSSSHSSEKKLKESSKEEKKKSKESHSGSNSQSKDKSTNGENGVKKEKREKVKSISKEKIINGIDSESGASFAEALGMCGPVSSQSIKKKTSSTDKKSVKPVETKPSESSRNSSKTSKHEESSSSSSSSRPVPELLAEEPREPLNICLSSLLPEITPNYKPTPINLDSQSKRVYNDDEALSRVMSNKNQRTKVYSGNKTVGKVESLFQICVRILQDNIDALEYTGGVPFLILKPILDRATPDQLFNMEHHNPYLIEDTDDLWQLHCQKEFRNKKREELESWREMYMRCLDEREARLSFITANIKQSQDKSEPVRTTKLAYVDSGFVKPPRNIARKQAKNGTVTTDRKITPTQKLSVIAKSGDTEKIAHPNPSSRATERTSNSSSAATKPKKAPLMAKTLSFLKNRFKR